LARLQKFKQEPSQGKKSFNLHVPMTVWNQFEGYCSKQNLTATEAINLLIKLELVEAMDEGVIPKNKRFYNQTKAEIAALSNEEDKADYFIEELKKPNKKTASVDKKEQT
jgi:hypothetical protein